MNWSSGMARAALLLPALGMSTGAIAGAKQYGPGVSDKEIKIRNTMPYSGPLSNVGTIGRAEAA